MRGLEAGPPQRVALVNMPFAGANRPSIQCGLLKAGLVREGHEVDVHYLNLELAAEIGEVTYRKLADLRWDHLLGEWLFSAAAFGPRDDEEAYREAHPSLQETLKQLEKDFDELRRMRNELFPELIARWADGIDWGGYRIVGFTSTFEQNVSSLALARRIKERWPEVVIVFGGANYDGEMGPEYVRAFPWIDYAVVGEGDQALPALVARVARNESALDVPGVAGRREDGAVKNGSAPIIRDLDALPDPDYDEFFAALMRLGRQEVLGESLPLLLFESARGCWWGAKHHCTFCGLNALGMAYRSKSPERVHAELRRQSARYQIANFEAVDNILDMRYLDALCEPLIEDRVDYSIFYEVKANLKREQLHTLSRAGIRILQPGIESLSTHVLKLMRKGTTMLQNVRLMKWAHYYGIKVAWNLLTGFPGETLEDYERQARLMPLLVHLPPADRRRRDLDGALQPVLHRRLVPGHRRRALGGVQLRLSARAGRAQDRLLLHLRDGRCRARGVFDGREPRDRAVAKALGGVAQATASRISAGSRLDPGRRPARRRGNRSAFLPGD